MASFSPTMSLCPRWDIYSPLSKIRTFAQEHNLCGHICMKRDIREEDLHDLLTTFYATIGSDVLLAPYFAEIDMSVHMPVIVRFWSTIVFNTLQYSGNAFRPHLSMPGLTAAHFARWLATLESTVNERFSGMRADHMKTMAHRIAYSMQLRLGISPLAETRANQTSA